MQGLHCRVDVQPGHILHVYLSQVSGENTFHGRLIHMCHINKYASNVPPLSGIFLVCGAYHSFHFFTTLLSQQWNRPDDCSTIAYNYRSPFAIVQAHFKTRRLFFAIIHWSQSLSLSFHYPRLISTFLCECIDHSQNDCRCGFCLSYLACLSLLPLRKKKSSPLQKMRWKKWPSIQKKINSHWKSPSSRLYWQTVKWDHINFWCNGAIEGECFVFTVHINTTYTTLFYYFFIFNRANPRIAGHLEQASRRGINEGWPRCDNLYDDVVWD